MSNQKSPLTFTRVACLHIGSVSFTQLSWLLCKPKYIRRRIKPLVSSWLHRKPNWGTEELFSCDTWHSTDRFIIQDYRLTTNVCLVFMSLLLLRVWCQDKKAIEKIPNIHFPLFFLEWRMLTNLFRCLAPGAQALCIPMGCKACAFMVLRNNMQIVKLRGINNVWTGNGNWC